MSQLIIFEPSVQTSNEINGYQIEVKNPYEFIYFDDARVVAAKIRFKNLQTLQDIGSSVSLIYHYRPNLF